MRPKAHGVEIPKPGLKSNTRRPCKRAATSVANRSTLSPRPRMTTGARAKKSGQSEPSVAATSTNRSNESSPPASPFNAHNAATASLLPPPNPAPIGMRFSRKNFAPPVHPVTATKARAAFHTRFVSSTGTAASSHSSSNRAAPPPPTWASTRKVSPNSTGATTDTRS